MAQRRFRLPDLGIGIGLRRPHVSDILQEPPAIGFLEVITENALDARGTSLEALQTIAARHAVVLHGVSLSIGSTDPLDLDYVRAVRDLADQLHARWVSDHVCWTGVHGVNTHDLLPLPYTEDVLAHVAERVRIVSDVLGRPLVLENPSSYVSFHQSTLSEELFLTRLAEEADCGLLLDVNNVYVSAANHGFDPEAYIDAIPAERVVQIHVAGHDDKGTHLLDTHGRAVHDDVWALYARFVDRAGPTSTLLEWDTDIPSLEEVLEEARKAEAFLPPRSLHAAS